MADQNIKVFVTYSWDEVDHNTQVLALTDQLRKNGFEATNDKLLSQAQGSISLDRMMVEHLTKSDKVVVVLSEGYAKKANGFQGGVGMEYEFIISDIKTKPAKYILVALQPYKTSLLPAGFTSRSVINITTQEGMNELVRKLSDQPEYIASPVADTIPRLPSINIPAFEFKVKPVVDVAVVDKGDDSEESVWDAAAAADAFAAAVADGDTELIKAVIRENSFLFFDLYERKMSAMPIFHEVEFGGMKADFAWLDDASDGPRWFLVKLARPDIELVGERGMASPSLLAEIEEVKAWANYFEVNPAEKKRLFGAVNQFRFRLIAGTREQWQTEQAQQWRAQHNKNSFVEIRSYQTFTKSLNDLTSAPGEFYRFIKFPFTSPASDMEKFWKNYRYMDDWRKWL